MTPAEVRLRSGLEVLGLPLDAAGPLAAYLELMRQWNRRINLTAITDPLAMASQHVLDSLALHADIDAGALLDVGSGAGLPGLPLATVRPDLNVLSVESRHKKVAFQREAARALGLANYRAECQRVESLEPGVHPQIICRAFAPLPRFVGLCGPLLAPGGRLLAMKGKIPEVEIAEMPEDWEVVRIARLAVPMLEQQRHLLIIQRRR